jgi:hypothetical protein
MCAALTTKLVGRGGSTQIGWKIPEWESYSTRSMDHGVTWSEPSELIAGDHGGRGPVKNKNIVLTDGTWLAPASLEGPVRGTSREPCQCIRLNLDIIMPVAAVPDNPRVTATLRRSQRRHRTGTGVSFVTTRA